MTGDERAEAIQPTAQALIHAVHSHDPDAVAHLLARPGLDWPALAVVLAHTAADPDALTGGRWETGPGGVQVWRPDGDWSPEVKRDELREAREDELYSDEEARAASRAWRRGDTGAWAEVGHRVWQRRRARSRKSRAALGVAS